ncbi:MAG TPA: PaaI family thioesterase [Gaiellaceae bacterium]|jgi:uncharacterized protein (TIGR00369 family)|nr:PaaI family thioesterase [Gaiellaceae bacterium]
MGADVEARVRRSFARQEYMTAIGAELVHVAPGEVDIALAFSERLTQQDGYLHAGVVAGAADSACGYAALTTMDADAEVLTVEFKINLLAPAAGERLVARGRVLRTGRTLTVCRGDAVAISGGGEKHVATLTATLIAITRGGSDLPS